MKNSSSTNEEYFQTKYRKNESNDSDDMESLFSTFFYLPCAGFRKSLSCWDYLSLPISTMDQFNSPSHDFFFFCLFKISKEPVP